MTSGLSIGYHGGSEQYTSAELVELAVAVEAAGFDVMTASDHFHPWQHNQGHAGHAWLTLAAIGQRTERLVLGSSVTCPSYRYHPAEVAHAFATLAIMYPGRVYLGVGTGEAVNEAPVRDWGPFPERLERLEEAIAIIRRLWSEEWVDHEGKHYRVRGANLYDRPVPSPPIYVAASGPKSARLAGREGDGWITDTRTALHGLAVQESFAEGARASGRDPAALPRLVELWAVVGTREEAIEAARPWLFLPIFNKVVGVADPREIQRIGEEFSSPERVIESWVVSTDPEEHVAAIAELADAGVTHVFVHAPQPDQRRLIDFYAGEVLPNVRR